MQSNTLKNTHFRTKLILIQINITELSVRCDGFHIRYLHMNIIDRLNLCSSFFAFCYVWHIWTLIFIKCIVPQPLLAVPDWLPRGDLNRPSSRRRLRASASGRLRIRSLSACPLGKARPRVRERSGKMFILHLMKLFMLTVKFKFIGSNKNLWEHSRNIL
jgi:hypothetical protein